MSREFNVVDMRKVVEEWSAKAATPMTPEEIRKSREYWGSMPWHPEDMRHPALKKPRSRNKKVRHGC